jgi:predicted site-specific integrase-resolvase
MDTITRKQAAERLNISLRTFERLRRKGIIPDPVNTLKSMPHLFDTASIDALRD